MTNKRVRVVVYVALISLVCWLMGCFGTFERLVASSTTDVKKRNWIARLEELRRATLVYATNSDDRFPPAHEWMDSLAPYVGSSSAFCDPGCSCSTGGAEYCTTYNAGCASEKDDRLTSEMILYCGIRGRKRNSSEVIGYLHSPGTSERLFITLNGGLDHW